MVLIFMGQNRVIYHSFILLFYLYSVFNFYQEVFMPRKARSLSQTNYFHVMVQGINRSYIFKKDDEAKEYISLLYKIKEDYKLDIITFCVMQNHVHILIKALKTEELGTFMKRVNLSYSIFYNKKYNRVGYVFRDRYKSQEINSITQLYICMRYIYNNPIKANLCTNPKDYPYLKYDSNIYENIKELDGSFKFIEYENNIDIKEIVQQYIKENSLCIDKNREDMRKLIKYLKEEQEVSFRKMQEIIGLERKTLSRIYKQS